jgi:hypothetical protein
MKVDFVIAGTQKGGTSALDFYLRQHSSISMAKVKEVHYFDTEMNFQAQPDYTKYHSYFDAENEGKIWGEATPIYMYWYSAPRRMWEYNPLLKIILVLRNPIERAYSHWNMERDRGWESNEFIDAINEEAERCREALPLQHRVYSYTDRGFYSEQIRRLWHYFSKEQILIIRNDELRMFPEKTLNQVTSFLGVEEFVGIRQEDIHSRPYKRKMTQAEYAFLRDLYTTEIKSLETLLGWDCSDWLQCFQF